MVVEVQSHVLGRWLMHQYHCRPSKFHHQPSVNHINIVLSSIISCVVSPPTYPFLVLKGLIPLSLPPLYVLEHSMRVSNKLLPRFLPSSKNTSGRRGGSRLLGRLSDRPLSTHTLAELTGRWPWTLVAGVGRQGGSWVSLLTRRREGRFWRLAVARHGSKRRSTTITGACLPVGWAFFPLCFTQSLSIF